MVAEPPVIDASPFIVLALGGRLDFLQFLEDRIVLPRQVEREVLGHDITDAAVEALRTQSWIEIVDVGGPPPTLRRYRLDAGEEAVVTWALSHPTTVAVIDDQRGRRVAQELGIPVIGTLGLVVEARVRGIVPAVRPVVEQLLATTGWYLSPTLLNAALARVGE